MSVRGRERRAATVGCVALLLLWSPKGLAQSAETVPSESVVLLDEAAAEAATTASAEGANPEAADAEEAPEGASGASDSTSDSSEPSPESAAEASPPESGTLRLIWGAARDGDGAAPPAQAKAQPTRKPLRAPRLDGRLLLGASMTAGGLFLDNVAYGSTNDALDGTTFTGGTAAPLLGNVELGYELAGMHQAVASFSVGGNAITGLAFGENQRASWVALAGYRLRLSFGPVHPFLGVSAGWSSLQAAVNFSGVGGWLLSNHEGFTVEGRGGFELGSSRISGFASARAFRVFVSPAATLMGGELGLRLGF